jgi:hypothetical protein
MRGNLPFDSQAATVQGETLRNSAASLVVRRSPICILSTTPFALPSQVRCGTHIQCLMGDQWFDRETLNIDKFPACN